LAFGVALLWALHPLNSECVVYITQRTELVMGLFFFATLYGSLRYWTASTSTEESIWLTFSALTCLLGMASKEVMVTAPVIVLLFDRTFVAGSLTRAWRRSWRLYVALFGGWLLLVWLHHSNQRAGSTGFQLGVPAHVWWLSQTRIVWQYLRLAVWPWPLSIHYASNYLTTISDAWPWVLATTLLAGTVVVLLWRRKAAGFVGACFFIILSPTLVVPIVTEIAADRRMYVPLATMTALVVVGGYHVLRSIAMRRESAESMDARARIDPRIQSTPEGENMP
jgi:hypothetical protein